VHPAKSLIIRACGVSIGDTVLGTIPEQPGWERFLIFRRC
jgi:hypothetical protein